jgi:hypothetical protein
MKKSKIGLLVLVIIVVYYFFFSTSAAVRYHNRLVKYHESVVNKFDTFFDRLTSDLQTGVVPAYNKLKKHIDHVLEKVENTGDFKGHSQLREVILSMMRFYKSYAEEDCRRLLNLVYMEDSKRVSDDDRQQIQEIIQTYKSRFASFQSRYNAVRQEFIDQFQIESKEE